MTVRVVAGLMMAAFVTLLAAISVWVAASSTPHRQTPPCHINKAEGTCILGSSHG